MDSIYDRAVYVLGRLHDQISESSLREEILNRTRREMDQQQREYFLQQQMRTIQEELGTGPSADDEIEELRKKGKEKLWSEAVAEIYEKELRKAERLNPQSPDFSIQMQYLRTILELLGGSSVRITSTSRAQRRSLTASTMASTASRSVSSSTWRC